MMNESRAQLFQAYLDGELSTGEAAEFETTLSESDRERLTAEMRFEGALADKLSEHVECSDDLWKRTLEKIKQSDTDTVEKTPLSLHPMPHRRWYIGAASLVAAACLAFVLSVYAPVRPSATSSVVLAAQSVEELIARTEVTPELENVQDYIRKNAIDLDIQELGNMQRNNHHTFSILGADTEVLNGENVVEILVECCEYPVKLLLAERNSQAAHEIGLAIGRDSDIQATRNVGKYLTAIVGTHPTHNLLDALQ